MSEQKKGEIVNHPRKCFDTKMTELGFTHQSTDLYQQAFSHSNFINDFNMNRLDHNECLEFLGDTILGLTISRYLSNKHPNLPERNLAKIRATIICESSFVISADRAELNEMILFGKGKEKTRGRTRLSLISDTLEAFIGVLHLGRRLDIVWKFAEKVIFLHVGQNELLGVVSLRTQSQGHVHQQSKDDVTYNLIKGEGPTHHRLFTSEVALQKEAIAEGKGKTKEESEQRAAESACKQLE